MNRCKRVLAFVLLLTMLAGAIPMPARAEENAGLAGRVLINEIESNDENGGPDWVELINVGDADVDVGGWILADDKGLDRLTAGETTPLADGTVLKAGGLLVLEEGVNFTFGLGKNDTVNVYNRDQVLVDTFSYTGHAAGTYSREIGKDTFVDQPATKGAPNMPPVQQPAATGRAVINEVDSAPADWVEIMNVGQGELDLSGYELRDNSDDHRWRFADGTKVASGALLLVDELTEGLAYDDTTQEFAAGSFNLGLGSGDSIRLFDAEGNLADAYTWTQHAAYGGQQAAASYGRYPDGTGAFTLTKQTPGEKNEWYPPMVVINEVESDDANGGPDWVEIMNIGGADVDVSGWFLVDDKGLDRFTAGETTPLAEGTVLKAGGLLVFEENGNFSFGLGKADCAAVYDRSGNLVASYSWTAHASGVYARIPDGTGEFQDFPTATKGKLNKVTNPVVINEVQSNDPDGGPDWIELANPTNGELDISGLVIQDEKDKDPYTIPEGTVIPARGYLVLKEGETFQFGLGKGDSVRIFENGELIQSTTWPAGTHTSPTWGLYPDVDGAEYRNTREATPGAANKFHGQPDLIPWPGSNIIRVSEFSFLEDSSGLDFHNGQLYLVDNGTGIFWVLDVDKTTGALSFAPGYSDGEEGGKRVVFQKDANNLSAAGPDAEGICVDGSGMVYLAVERDNSAKGVNKNMILMVNPNTPGNRIVAEREWNITDLLPDVAANMGIEAVEWIPNAALTGKLVDESGKAYDPADYPGAIAGGLFFVALEDNGHVYAFALYNDGTARRVADIDSLLGGAMDLSYDDYEDVLWIYADNGYGNRCALLRFDGTPTGDIVHVAPPTGLDITKNYEGFAIADASYRMNGCRMTFRVEDGVKGAGDLCYDYDVQPAKPSDPTGSWEAKLKLPNRDAESSIDLSRTEVRDLEDEAATFAQEGKNVCLTMTLAYRTALSAAPNALKQMDAIASGSSLELFALDLALTVDGETTAPAQTGGVLELKIPFDDSRKTNLALYRSNDDAAQALRELDARPERLQDGTFYAGEDGYLYLYTKTAGLYGVGYDTTATVTYLDGEQVLKQQTYVEGQGLKTLYKPTKSGYRFSGWYTEEELKHKVTSLDEKTTGDVTLYAKWQKSASGDAPQTGDTIAPVLIVLAVSALGLAILAVGYFMKKKKNRS